MEVMSYIIKQTATNKHTQISNINNKPKKECMLFCKRYILEVFNMLRWDFEMCYKRENFMQTSEYSVLKKRREKKKIRFITLRNKLL